ncbi:hypothetical protein CVV26_02775 [Candidatus Kuenenbacteria bacterium HGW-Kuenenbacteria-1]|uniref:Uncharacterized protein n=1 Tax=Candidatus Kuenenbacteria bacterium HGW-Kuenenbacteria-1 TaxID=2013812 RepID=A0A2N1UN18_9BACT|nr:MAG: hypothetical protein CVV26_02775 [Candidatus Kuenenbacteria bacterium HGW-Kuenenbacteria-1]
MDKKGKNMFDQNMLKQNLIKVLGLENLPEEQKLSLIEKMTDVIQKRLLIRITEELKDEDKDEFIKMSEEKNQMALVGFLQAKIPNLNKIIMEEMTKFKQELVENK